MKTIFLFIFLLMSILAGCESSDINFTYSDKSMDYVSVDGTGTGGSMARFTIVGNYLYTVDGRYLKTFDISNANQMVLKSSWALDWSGGIETIFAYHNKLFLGTNSGMHIIDIGNPMNPSYISKYEHVVSCDPVVVSGDYAYVTLHSGGNRCWRNVNMLQVIDLSDILNPKELKSYPMSNPKGLGVDNDLLFVCDNGLKVFKRNTPTNLVQINHFTNLTDAYDVIPYNGILILIAADGLHQYAYENNAVSLLSSISVIQP